MSAGYAEPRKQAEPAHFEIFSLRDEVHWRLLSRNNRDGGQSSAGFDNVAECRAGIARLLELLPQLQAQYVLTAQNRWNWALAFGPDVLARSSHSFDRRIRCIAACDWFYRTAPLAGIRDGLRVVRIASRTPGRPTPTSRSWAAPGHEVGAADLSSQCDFETAVNATPMPMRDVSSI